MMNDHIITVAPDLNGDGEVAGIDSTGGYALYYASRAYNAKCRTRCKW